MNVNQGASQYIRGTLTLDATDQQLPKQSCKRVWLCHSTTATAGAHTSAADAYIGAKNTGGTVGYAKILSKTDTVGIYEHVISSDVFYIKGTAGDKIEYLIEV